MTGDVPGYAGGGRLGGQNGLDVVFIRRNETSQEPQGTRNARNYVIHGAGSNWLLNSCESLKTCMFKHGTYM